LRSSRLCLSVSLSVRSCISKTTCPNLTESSVYVMVAVVRSCSDDNAIRYVLPVLWMTSHFLIMRLIQIKAIGELFTVTRQVAPLITFLSLYSPRCLYLFLLFQFYSVCFYSSVKLMKYYKNSSTTLQSLDNTLNSVNVNAT